MALLNRESTTENVDFSKRKDAEPDSKRKGVVRFPTLPSNWGPKAKAKDNRSVYAILWMIYLSTIHGLG